MQTELRSGADWLQALAARVVNRLNREQERESLDPESQGAETGTTGYANVKHQAASSGSG